MDEIMAVNARGPMLVSKHAGPARLERGGGSIINIASALSLRGDDEMSAYSASKAALNQITPSRGRRVRSPLHPRQRRPRFGDRHPAGPGRAAAPDLANGFTLTNDPSTRDVADAVVFLASDLSVHVTGQVISIDGGQLAHIPTDVTTPGGAAAEVLTRGVTQLTPPTRR